MAHAGISRIVFTLLAVLAFGFSANANTVLTAQGAGNDIPDANTVTFDATFTNSGVIAPGYSLVLTLLGFQYDWSGDLIVNLSFQPTNILNPTISADVFNQLGVTPGNPSGFGSIFGGAGTNGGNYVFNSNPSVLPFDLWQTVSGLASTDSIPEGTYFPITHTGSSPYYVASNLSSMFTNVNVAAGTWILTITNSDPDSSFASPYDGWVNGFVGFELDATVIPEPPSAAIFSVLAVAFLAGRRIARRRTGAL